MESLKVLERVLVVGTCNFSDRIDAAVLRRGQFDLKVEVPLPGAQALSSALQGENPARDHRIALQMRLLAPILASGKSRV